MATPATVSAPKRMTLNPGFFDRLGAHVANRKITLPRFDHQHPDLSYFDPSRWPAPADITQASTWRDRAVADLRKAKKVAWVNLLFGLGDDTAIGRWRKKWWATQTTPASSAGAPDAAIIGMGAAPPAAPSGNAAARYEQQSRAALMRRYFLILSNLKGAAAGSNAQSCLEKHAGILYGEAVQLEFDVRAGAGSGSAFQSAAWLYPRFHDEWAALRAEELVQGEMIIAQFRPFDQALDAWYTAMLAKIGVTRPTRQKINFRAMTNNYAGWTRMEDTLNTFVAEHGIRGSVGGGHPGTPPRTDGAAANPFGLSTTMLLLIGAAVVGLIVLAFVLD